MKDFVKHKNIFIMYREHFSPHQGNIRLHFVSAFVCAFKSPLTSTLGPELIQKYGQSQ